jgi:hypothetical protein
VNRRFQVTRTDEPPTIDGRIDEEVWRRAVVLKDFVISRRVSDASLPQYAAAPTEAMVLFDDTGLYVAVRARQDPATIYTQLGENGLLQPDLDWETGTEKWANTGCDEIEVSIDPELTRASYFTFHVNPDGVMQKTYMPCARVWDGFYKRIDPVVVADDNWTAAVTRDDDGWYVEMSIPYESIDFRPIEPVGEGDVYFDMVQDRTVMGLNVSRVVHGGREPSSWSPSHGAMFFRDAENFGQAYFRPVAVRFEEVRCGDFFKGERRVEVSIGSATGEGAAVIARAAITGPDYTRSTETKLLVSGRGDSPGASSTTAALQVVEGEALPPGRYRLDVTISGEDGYLFDRATYLFETPEPVDVTALKTVLYENERDLPIRVVLNMPEGSADALRLKVLSGAETLAELSAETPAFGLETLLPLEVGGLTAGAYTLKVEALNAELTVAEGAASISVIEDPFEREFAGTAGAGVAPAAGEVPPGFRHLGAGDVGRVPPKAVEGGTAYLDETSPRPPFLLYAVTPTDDFYAGNGAAAAAPRGAQLDEPIRAFAAGGEYEPLSFAVFALEDLADPVVEFTEAVNDTGASIPKSWMDLRAERPDGFLVGREVLGSMAKGAARRYFLTVRVPPGIPAGLYRGALTFSAEGSSPLEKEYSLLVLPFALEDSPIVASIYGRLYGDERDGPQCDDLLAHGFNNFTCINVLPRGQTAGVRVHHLIWGIDKPTGEGWTGDDPQKFGMVLDENVFANIKACGLTGPIVVDVNRFLRYLPCTRENAARFAEFARRIEAMRREYELDEFVYHVVDEPNNHFTYDDGRYGRRYGIERVAFFGEVLNDLGLRQYVTVNSTQRGYDIADKAFDQTQIWCPNYISDEKSIYRWTARRKELWLYNYAGDGRCKGTMRSTYGLYALSIGATGVTIWHHPRFVRRVRAENRLLDSSAWEAAREGVDDARYVAMLVALIEDAYQAGGPAARLAADAEDALDAIIYAYPVITSEKVEFERAHDASDWNKWRWIIADWIMKLAAETPGAGD